MGGCATSGGVRRARGGARDPPPAPRLALTEASRRWATLLQQNFEVDPLACPTCRGPMRIIACITHASVIGQILTHLRSRAARAAHAGAVAGRRHPRTGACEARSGADVGPNLTEIPISQRGNTLSSCHEEFNL